MINNALRVNDIRNMFKQAYTNKEFTIDRTGAKTIEIIGCTFIADEEYIIREPSQEYIKRELGWYRSMSLYVQDIPGKVPAIWEAISSEDGKINSNYGWCIYSPDNGEQYNNVLNELKANPYSRRATMIYNRPSMHVDFSKDGMNDFMCTFANTFFIRNNELVSHFVMRSTDSVFGYGNDYAWAKYVQQQLLGDLREFYPNVEMGDIIWSSSNFHVYERHFPALEKMIKTLKM
jgi:thymidylate synthase